MQIIYICFVLAPKLTHNSPTKKAKTDILLSKAQAVVGRKSWDGRALQYDFKAALQTRRAGSLVEIVGILKDLLASQGQAGALSGLAPPSGSTICRLYFRMDAALMLRRRSFDTMHFRFLMADSSPQGGRDWLLSRATSFAKQPSLLRRVFADLLEENRRAAGEKAGTAQEQVMFLHKHLIHHALPPVAMGLSQTNVARKSSALIHAHMLECKPRDVNIALLATLSMTGDLGTEIGIPDFRSPFKELLPPWQRQWVEELVPDYAEVAAQDTEITCEMQRLQRQVVAAPGPLGLEVDGDSDAAASSPEPEVLVEDGVAWHSDDEGQPTPATQEADAMTILQEAWQANPQWHTMIFPFAMAVPGTLQIVNNLLHEADTLMTAWKEWWGQLKNINALLSNQLRLNKFCARCLCGLPDEDELCELFARKLPQLYTKRWNCVTTFVRKCKKIIGALRRHWKDNLYGGQEEQDGGGIFNPKKLSETLRSPFFEAYLDMVLMVNQVMEDCAGWCEGCLCHPPPPRSNPMAGVDMNDPERLKALGGLGSCPMQSRRAPEMAAGEWQAFIAGLFKLTICTLAARSRSLLTTAEWATLTSDMDQARACCEAVIALKLKCWSVLPLKLWTGAPQRTVRTAMCSAVLALVRRDPR